MAEKKDIKFDKKLEPYDWRYSAAILGLIKFFNYHDTLKEHYKVEDDFIEYDSSFITQERYFEFVEYYYGEKLHHIKIKNMLSKEAFTDEDIKQINEKLSANTILKKVFKGVKFDGSNKNQVLDLLSKNKDTILFETYKNKSDMYRNYANNNQFFSKDQKYCRLNGYSIDANRKGKSIGFCFDANTYVGTDIFEMDFTPFAFCGDRVTFFINDNYSLDRLKVTNDMLSFNIRKSLDNEEYKNSSQILFKCIIESSDFINYDVEVISKDIDNDYFETLYIRRKNIEILQKIKDYKAFCTSYKVNDNYYIDIQKEAINCVLNNVLADSLIEMLIKSDRNYNYLVAQFINLNILIKGVDNMQANMYKAHLCAVEVVKKLDSNKLKSYRQKLISAMSFKDYDRVCQILMNLSQYTGVYFSFTYDLYEDFEKNKEVAYTFINDLDIGVLNRAKNTNK